MMLISFTLPCHGRAHDLKQVMPRLIECAAMSPPAEIAVVDYSSPDDLAAYMRAVMVMPMPDGVKLAYRKYSGCDHFRLAHARNLAAKLSHGGVIVVTSADIWFEPGYLPAVREAFEGGAVWARCPNYKGAVAVKREEFMAAGGFDERIIYYGPDDRDLENRLALRGGRFVELPRGLIHVIRTPNSVKVEGYGVEMSKRQMVDHGHVTVDDNLRRGVLVANQGREWGQWT